MSKTTTDTPHNPAEVAETAQQEARVGASFLHTHRWRLLLLFVGLLLPLWGFEELADDIRRAGAFPFDEPMLRFAHGMARDGFDRFFVFFSAIGYRYGVVPVDLVLIVVFALRRRFRESIFVAVATGGAALLNMAAKHWFARARPNLWESISPETTFSFPSAHAMGSATLAVVVILLAWPTRWRWLAIVAMSTFVAMVGLSRIYLGVHYPSDILAGWAAAAAWVIGVYVLVFYGSLRPWQARDQR
ncbi:MAG: phosphatase PAP2 family protein [Pseudomonadota bacterium]|nr:phosphatase PAP2 family protein [Pseudomonadota bacterium]